MNGQKYVPGIDGLRAIAVLMVVAHHTGIPGVGGGSIGVDVFFVLSGYLITGVLQGELAATGRLSFQRFYARRALRLWPALSFMLAGVLALLAIGVLKNFPGAGSAVGGAIVAATYLSDLQLAANHAPLEPFLHTWSLAVEEQFYLVWPLTLLWLVRRSRPASIAVAAAGLSAVVLLVVSGPLHHARAGYAFPITHATGLLLGAALALAPTAGKLLARAWLPCSVGLAVLVLVLPRELAFGRACGIVAASVLTVPILAQVASYPRARLSRVLSTRPLRAVGKWSYAIYLWNYPLTFGLRIAHPTAPATFRNWLARLCPSWPVPRASTSSSVPS